MSTSAPAEWAAALESHHLRAEAEGNVFWLIGDDGETEAKVSNRMSADDLAEMLRYGRRMLGLGRKVGQSEIQSSLRALINAAPLEPLT